MGNGMNYIREIMSMNLPDTPAVGVSKVIACKRAQNWVEAITEEKTVKVVATEGFSRYQFVGYMDDDECLLMNNNRVVVGLRIGDRGQVQIRAHAGDVIMHRNRLYAWCERLESFANDKDKLLRVGMWLEFNPGPCTLYHGPTPDISLEPNKKEENMAVTRYDRIPYGYMSIKNVVFNDPATIVMWEDGRG